MGAGASAPETLHKTLEETSETDLAKALHDLPAETRAKLREAIATGKAETGATGQEATNISTPRGSAEQKQLLADPGTPPTVTVTTEELAEAIDTVISLGMQMDREMKTNEEDQNAPGEAGRFAQYRTPRLRRKSRDLSEKFQDLMGPKLEAIFKQFDADGNGTLDASELKAAFEAAGRPAEEETIQNAIKKLDTDGDGVISLEEFKAIAWQCSVDGG